MSKQFEEISATVPFLVKVGEVLADPGADLIFLFTFVKSISKTPGISFLFLCFCLCFVFWFLI
jgi:hypothetical protein